MVLNTKENNIKPTLLTVSEFVTMLQEGKEFTPGTVVEVLGIYRTAEEILHPAFQPDTSAVPKL